MKGPKLIKPGVPPLVHEIGAALREREMSIAHLARAAGLERTNVQGWFVGDTQPTMRSARAVANVFGLEIGMVVRKDGE